MLENYIHPRVLERLVPGSVITYTDFMDAKRFCKAYPDGGIRASLGGGNVAERHYQNLTFDDIRLTWLDGTDDEFIDLYDKILAKL
jgi:putative ATP-dependent endonuclease of the OLD family